MKQSLKYSKQNQGRFIKELLEWLKIPSISANPDFKKEVLKAAQFVVDNLKKIGLDKVVLHKTLGNPIITAEKIIDPKMPTVLIYGHYDVQPPDPLNLWESPPFEPVIKKKKIYARGASDDKGQLFIHFKAVESLLANQELPLNIKFLIEGEEEVSSVQLFPFLEKHKKSLQSDCVLISDTEMYDSKTPAITYGMKGLAYLEVLVKGPNRDLHSGMYGGVVINPANVLTKLLAGLSDNNHRITVKGFYDQVKKLSPLEKEELEKLPFDEKKFMTEVGIKKIFKNQYSFYERNMTLPTFEINGMESGYTGEGTKTIIPSWARAKLSFRLVPDQDYPTITRLVKKHLKDNFLKDQGLELEIKSFLGGNPAVFKVDSLGIQAAKIALKKVFGNDPYLVRSGASIPIVREFQKKLKNDVILMGFGLGEDKIHSPNENFPLKNFKLGIESSIIFLKTFSDLAKLKK